MTVELSQPSVVFSHQAAGDCITALRNGEQQIKPKHSTTLLKQPGICGVDVQTDAAKVAVICIRVDTNDAKLLANIPTRLDGITVKSLRTGPFRKQA